MYGQHTLCITLKKGIKDIQPFWANFRGAKPLVYFNSFAEGVLNTQDYTRYPKDTVSLEIHGFTIITKPKGNKSTVYEKIFNPFWTKKIGSGSFYVQTWGRSLTTSVCSGASEVINIKNVKMLGYEFRNSQDHSKWALHTNPETALFCTQDLNHRDSQDKRGGNFFCLKNKGLYKAVSQFVVKTGCGFLPGKKLEEQTPELSLVY